MPEPATIRIALWGLSGSGKTALLAYLLHASPDTGWDVRPRREASSFVKMMRQQRALNRFPSATPLHNPARVVYTLNKGDRQAILHVEDRSGGEWKELPEDVKHELVQELTNAHALIVLLDPTGAYRDLEDQVRNTLERLCEERGVPHETRPVALCLTKADTFVSDVESLVRAKSDPDGFAAAHLHARLRTSVARLCSNARFFPVSTVGVRASFGVVTPAVIADETLTLRPVTGGQPINLTEPFEWIFSELGQAV